MLVPNLYFLVFLAEYYKAIKIALHFVSPSSLSPHEFIKITSRRLPRTFYQFNIIHNIANQALQDSVTYVEIFSLNGKQEKQPNFESVLLKKHGNRAIIFRKTKILFSLAIIVVA